MTEIFDNLMAPDSGYGDAPVVSALRPGILYGASLSVDVTRMSRRFWEKH